MCGMTRERKAVQDHYDCRMTNSTRGVWLTHEELKRRRKKIDDAFAACLASVQTAVEKLLAAWRAAKE